jgi:hypothetical protein
VTVESWVTETFTNAVRIDTSTPETDDTNNDDEEPTDVWMADAWILKSTTAIDVVPNQEFDFVLQYGYTSTLDIPAENVVVSDTLPSELDFVTSTPAPVSTDTLPLLRWDLGTLQPGDKGAITLTVQVKPDITSMLITNTAQISTTTPESDYTNNEDSAEVPTPVQLLYFWARPLVGSVLIEWATAWEIDTYGFYLLRSETGNLSDAVEVAFVPAEGRGQGSGGTYSYLDRTVGAGLAYSYWLVDVDTNGRRTVRGPVVVPPLFLSWFSVPYQDVILPRFYG